jgi:hypothetical protein
MPSRVMLATLSYCRAAILCFDGPVPEAQACGLQRERLALQERLALHEHACLGTRRFGFVRDIDVEGEHVRRLAVEGGVDVCFAVLVLHAPSSDARA